LYRRELHGDTGDNARCGHSIIRFTQNIHTGEITVTVLKSRNYGVYVTNPRSGTHTDLFRGDLPGHQNPPVLKQPALPKKKRQKRIKIPTLFTPDELITTLMTDDN